MDLWLTVPVYDTSALVLDNDSDVIIAITDVWFETPTSDIAIVPEISSAIVVRG